MSDQFTALLKQFGKTIGITDLTDDNGYCCLFFDDITVNMEERDSTLFLYTTVAELPESGREKLFARLLEANCFFKETRGATLGADLNAGIILLCYQTPLAVLDDIHFEKTIENFINITELWMTNIRETVSDAAPENGSSPAYPGIRV